MKLESEVFLGGRSFGEKGVFRQEGALNTTFIPDEDAAAYFDRITAAGSSISETNKVAVNELILGLKRDGLWKSIKSACLLAGPSDLAGALIPLVGGAPISIGFAPQDHHLSTGLQGDGSEKHLDSQRANNADPKNDNHVAVYITHGGIQAVCGANMSGRHIYDEFPTAGEMWIADNSNDQATPDDTGSNTVGFVGLSRQNGTRYDFRRNGTTHLIAQPSTTHVGDNMKIFSRGGQPYSGRIAFYSLGESLDLVALDSRISNYLRSIDDEDAMAYAARANITEKGSLRKINDWIRGLKKLDLYDSLIEGWVYRSSLNAGNGTTIHGLKGTSDGIMAGATHWSNECVTMPALSISSISYHGITIPSDTAGLFFAGEKLINNAFTFSEPVVLAHGGSNSTQRGWQTLGTAIMFGANGTRLDIYDFSDAALPQIVQVTNGGATQADYNGHVNAGPAIAEAFKGGTPTWSTLATTSSCITQSHSTYPHEIKLRFIGLWNADIASRRVALTDLYHATIGAP